MITETRAWTTEPGEWENRRIEKSVRSSGYRAKAQNNINNEFYAAMLHEGYSSTFCTWKKDIISYRNGDDGGLGEIFLWNLLFKIN